MNTQQKAKQLAEEIAFHDQKYYVENNPHISDYEYDMLVKKAEQLKEQSEDPALQILEHVGSDLKEGFTKVKHSIPMLSIENVYKLDELRNKLKKLEMRCDTAISFVVEPKVDGVSAALHYQNGELVLALTRGNGIVGDDITENVKRISNVPQTISFKQPVEVRGEIYLDRHLFEKFNNTLKASGHPGFANARNACAGSIKLHDPEKVAQRPLRFVAYRLFQMEGINTHLQQLQKLEALGFNTVKILAQCGHDRIGQAITSFHSVVYDVPYCMDGAIVSINELTICDQLGHTSKYPRWIFAFKFEPDVVETKLLGVRATVGRTGVVTPTAIMEPTLLAGTVVSKANLHNYAQIEAKDIRIGDIVRIRKAGEIIPEVCGVNLEKRGKHTERITRPVQCPYCKSELVYENPKLRCVNTACPSRMLERVIHFVSKSCMDIRHIGPAIIEKLILTGCLQTIADIYTLTETDFMRIGIGKEHARKILYSIMESKKQPAVRVLTALGIPLIGMVSASILLQHVKDIRELASHSVSSLEKLSGLGPTTAASIIGFFNDSDNLKLIDMLAQCGLTMVHEVVEKPMKCAAITGKVAGMDRGEIEKVLKRKGIQLKDSVTSETDFLIVGDTVNTSSNKYKKAVELKLPIHRLSKLLAS